MELQRTWSTQWSYFFFLSASNHNTEIIYRPNRWTSPTMSCFTWYLPVFVKTVLRMVQLSNTVSVDLMSSKRQSSNNESSNFTDFSSILMNLWAWDGTHRQANRQRKHGLGLLLLGHCRMSRMVSVIQTVAVNHSCYANKLCRTHKYGHHTVHTCMHTWWAPW